MNVDWLKRSQEAKATIHHFRDGKPVAGNGAILTKCAPRDGRFLCEFHEGSIDDVEATVASARRAFEDGRWSRAPATKRKAVLGRLASLIEEHAEELGLLECLDVGKPITDALRFDIPTSAAVIRHSAGAIDNFYGVVYGNDISSLSYQLRRPLGVVAGIVGWNFPLLLAAGKIGPALATGNSLVLKPSEMTSLSAGRVALLALEAGVPEGVLNVVNGGSTVGAALGAHPDVDLVTFTGSTRTGRKLLAASAGSNMKRLMLECGGKSPSIVFNDSPDLEQVADAVVSRAFWNQGQVCTAGSRLLVQAGLKDEFLRLVMAKAEKWNIGDPLKSETTFGAVVSHEHAAKVRRYIEGAIREGAKLVYQSNSSVPFASGCYVAPAIFDGVSPNQTVAQEEIFGPVLCITTFTDEEDAIRIANSTIYGLSASVWTTNLARANRVTQGIKAGWITVNATANPSGGPGVGVLSVAGHKESGFGTEGGIEGLLAYTSSTAVQWFV